MRAEAPAKTPAKAPAKTPAKTQAKTQAKARAEVLLLADEARLARLVPAGGVLATTTALLAQADALGLTVRGVTTSAHSPLACGDAHPLYIANICGKVEHFDVCRVTRAEVDPYLRDISDAFGSALCLYSRSCSLRISKALTNTLYRGGACSAAVAEVLEHALLPETVKSNTVHMIVASARLGRPVIMRDDFLARRMAAEPAWSCEHHLDEHEMQKYHGLKLHAFDPDWLRAHGLDDPLHPHSCLVNVCRTGTVNIFVSITPGVPFEVGIELRYTPMLEAVLAAVLRYT